MGDRYEPRTPVAVPVRVFGTDGERKIFSENVTTMDVSHHGAKILGLHARVALDEIIGITYGGNTAHFKVKWVGPPGTPAEATAGLLNLNSQRPFWDFLLPRAEIDTFLSARNSDRRRWPRVKCSLSIELRVPGQSVLWGKTSDLSQDGCCIEMAIPLPLETRFAMVVWLAETKLPLQAQVFSLAPGFGNGVRFLTVSTLAQEHLTRFIQSMPPCSASR
jgi:PilZ domain-containing protein